MNVSQKVLVPCARRACSRGLKLFRGKKNSNKWRRAQRMHTVLTGLGSGTLAA